MSPAADRPVPPEIAARFKDYPPKLRTALLDLRTLILETAAETEGVGIIEETLKWAQPSFITTRPKTGSTLRIDRVKGEKGENDEGQRYALYFICHSGLADRFREHYGDRLTIEGNRALVFRVGEELPKPAVKHCIAMALTWHIQSH